MLKIPSGTQSDAKFRLREKGAPNVRTKQKGDEHVIVSVVTPQKLSNDQKKLFEELAKLDNDPKEKSAWERFKEGFRPKK